jgi:hypothetical protein
MIRFTLRLLPLLVSLCAVSTLAAESPHNQRFGKTFLVEHRVPEATIRKVLHQIDEDVRHAVLGNAGTIISFRIGRKMRGLFHGSSHRYSAQRTS